MADTVVLPTPPDPQHTITDAFRHQVRQRGGQRRVTGLWPSRPVRGDPHRHLAHPEPSATSAAHRGGERVGQHLGLGRRDGVHIEGRHEEPGQGQVAPQPLDLLGGDGMAGESELPGGLERGQVRGIECHPGRVGHLGRRSLQPDGLAVAGVHDDRSQLHARLVLQGVGRLDRLRDRELLGQRDQDHPATGRVAQEVDDVLGLAAQGAAAGCADETAR